MSLYLPPSAKNLPKHSGSRHPERRIPTTRPIPPRRSISPPADPRSGASTYSGEARPVEPGLPNPSPFDDPDPDSATTSGSPTSGIGTSSLPEPAPPAAPHTSKSETIPPAVGSPPPPPSTEPSTPFTTPPMQPPPSAATPAVSQAGAPVTGSPPSTPLLKPSPTLTAVTGGASPTPPAARPARTLVLCFDGTGDSFDADCSNVVALFSMLKKDDRNEQMVYYQPGIGTYLSNTQNPSGIKARIDKILDEAIAWDLDAHVMGGYEFLMQNYQAGDKISLFGFSRGAYTARALAGMLHKVGLLPPCNHQQVPFAYQMFTKDDDDGWTQSNAFKKAFSIDVTIDFIGVWDTVGSVGVIPHSSLPFVQSNDAIRVFRHALALDERRVRFKPALYRYTPPEDAHGIHPGDMPRRDTTYAVADPDELQPLLLQSFREQHRHRESSQEEFCKGHGASRIKTDSLEVWFAGCHCDIGGGSVKNNTKFSLARIPLRWMVRECFKANTGIRFHAESLKQFGLDPATLNAPSRPDAIDPEPQHLRPEPDAPTKDWTEEMHEVHDALAQLYDQLSLKWYKWWPLEWFPTHAEDGALLWPNMGRGRDVPSDHKPFYVHRSVKMRLAANGLRDWKHGPYAPTANADWAHDPVWVD